MSKRKKSVTETEPHLPPREELERCGLQEVLKDIAVRLLDFHEGTSDDIWKRFAEEGEDPNASLEDLRKALSEFFSSWSDKERAAIFDGWAPSRDLPGPALEKLAADTSPRSARWALRVTACTTHREGQVLAARAPIAGSMGGPVTLVIEVGTKLPEVLEALRYFDHLIPRLWPGLIADPPQDSASVEGGPACLRTKPIRSVAALFREHLRYTNECLEMYKADRSEPPKSVP